MNNRLFLFSLVLLLPVPIFLAAAVHQEKKTQEQEKELKKGQPAYVSEGNQPLRKGPSAFNPIKKKLSAGTRVTVQLKMDRYVKVKLSSGEVGWVLNTALTTKKPASAGITGSGNPTGKEGIEEFLQNWEKYKDTHEVKISEKSKTAQQTAGAKGLNPSNKQNYNRVDGNFEDLKWMEKFSWYISSERKQDRRKFMAEGGLR